MLLAFCVLTTVIPYLALSPKDFIFIYMWVLAEASRGHWDPGAGVIGG